MHLGHKLVHACELIRRCLDDEVDAFADHIELRIGDQDCDLNKDIFFERKTRHFAVDPDQMGEFGSHSAQFRGLGRPSVNSG